MLFSKQTIVSFLCLTSAATQVTAAAVLPRDAPEDVTCQTTGASPSAGDVQDAINELRKMGANHECDQSNGGGSKCTTHATSKSAKISVCGKYDWGWEEGDKVYYCDNVAEKAQAVLDNCAGSGGFAGKVGGYWWTDRSSEQWIEISAN